MLRGPSSVAANEMIKVIIDNNDVVAVDTHSCYHDKVFTIPADGEYEFQCSGQSFKDDVVTFLWKNVCRVDTSSVLIRDNSCFSHSFKVNAIAGDTIYLHKSDVKYTHIRMVRTRTGLEPSRIAIVTDPVKFDRGVWQRMGEYMKINCSVENIGFPKGFDYDMSCSDFQISKTQAQIVVKVKGWTAPPIQSVPVQFSNKDLDSHQNYNLKGSFTIKGSGTYMIGDQKVKINEGSITLDINQPMRSDGKIDIPVKPVTD